MPSSSLAEYLAKNYLTADPGTERPKKKRKKTKQADAADGLIIADDDPPDLRSSVPALNANDDEDSPFVVSTTSGTGQFRRAKKSGWKPIAGGVAQLSVGADTTGQDHEAAAADAILASAAAESDARRQADEAEDAPVIANMDQGIASDDDGAGLPRMETGARAGLQTASQTAAMVAAQEKKRKSEAAKYKSAAQAQETIYRDASGRIINVAMKRAEARKAEEEKKLKEERAREALMGDVQRREKEARKQELHDARAMPLARTIDDEELNEELKARQRWNDPAAQFLTKSTGPSVSATGRPLYKGSFQPNRYGIRPGHRWDGMDRSNGFEKDWFAARNKQTRLEVLNYEWQYDE